jgi:hypothetical protein
MTKTTTTAAKGLVAINLRFYAGRPVLEAVIASQSQADGASGWRPPAWTRNRKQALARIGELLQDHGVDYFTEPRRWASNLIAFDQDRAVGEARKVVDRLFPEV